MGCHTLEELLQHQPHRLIKVFYLPSALKSHGRKKTLLERLEKASITLEPLEKDQLDRLCQSTSHQGFAAYVKKKSLMDLKSFFKTQKENAFVLALDSIYDPHNLGAILRACECFKVDLVIWSKNRGASLSPVVTKSSSAASEFVPIAQISNLATSLDLFKKEGYELLSAEISENARPLYQHSFSKKTLLVMGSEGEGVRSILSQKVDQKIYIPMCGVIDSLNVSQATAVFLNAWRGQLSRA